MATTSETTYTHTCDFCGAEHDKDDLAHLYGAPDPAAPMRPGDRADICPACRSRPAGEVLDFLAGKRKQPAYPR